MNKTSDSFPGYEDLEKYSQDALKTILLCTKAANALPSSGENFKYCKTFPGFQHFIKDAENSILSTMMDLLPSSSLREQFETEDLEEKFDMLQDINATIFENMDSQINEASGMKQADENLHFVTKTSIPIKTSWNKMNAKFNTKTKNFALFSSKNIVRPQLSFKEKVDNSNSPFVPHIKEKPNSIKPLAITLEKDGDIEEFCHPYEWEIEKFRPMEKHLQPYTPMVPKPVEDTPLVVVKDVQSLNALCEELKTVDEFALDIEHHSYRTFQGISCLLQISTREKDYIIDALELRSELWVLNEVFTDPKIVKVLHGADMDIQWLQRDFGLYIVNLFDTGQAARLLNFAHLSLAYVIKHYCEFDLDKQFQLADWRIRPLPEEMLKYAREDTHHLLYIYDCMKNDLVKRGNETMNLLLSVFQRSKEISLKKYKKLILQEDSYLELYRRSRKNFNAHQLFCLKELHAWRDKMARVEDESYSYVLPNHMLLQIAEVLPREQQGILACCNPIPPLVRQQLNELHSIVSKASHATLAQLHEKVDMQASQLNFSVDLHNMLDCPHDIRLYQDSIETSSVFSGHNVNSIVYDFHTLKVPLVKEPCLPLGRSEDKEDSNVICREVIQSIIKENKTPYERYLLTKKHYAVQEEDQKAVIHTESNSKHFIERLEDSTSTVAEDGGSIPNTNDAKSCVDMKRKSSDFEGSPTLKKKKLKNKQQTSQDTSDSAIALSDHSDEKESDNSVEIVHEVFKPFDYSQASASIFNKPSEAKRGKQNSFQVAESRSNFKNPHRPSQKRRGGTGKQSTFSNNANTTSYSNSVRKNWPRP